MLISVMSPSLRRGPSFLIREKVITGFGPRALIDEMILPVTRRLQIISLQ
jgi:hypothetical protein